MKTKEIEKDNLSSLDIYQKKSNTLSSFEFDNIKEKSIPKLKMKKKIKKIKTKTKFRSRFLSFDNFTLINKEKLKAKNKKIFFLKNKKEIYFNFYQENKKIVGSKKLLFCLKDLKEDNDCDTDEELILNGIKKNYGSFFNI